MRAFVLCVLLAALGACGFHLRSALPWPAEWKTAYITQDHARELAPVLHRVLAEKGVTLVEEPLADVVIELMDEQTARTSLAIDAVGKISEYALNYEVKCQARDRAGNVVLPLQRFRANRSYAFAPADALGHEIQEQQMYQAMRRQVVGELLEQLTALAIARQGGAAP